MENSNFLRIEDLKKSKIFINYKVDKKDNGDVTKPPVDPKDCDTFLNISDATKFVNYETALFNQNQGRCDGVGLVLTSSNNYALCGIDIDSHKSDTNMHVEELKMLFDGTYMEISPSGKGLHILFLVRKDAIPTNYKNNYFQKNSKEELECYVGGISTRYFTFTENIHGLKECPIADMTEQFLAFIDKYMKHVEQIGAQDLTNKVAVKPEELEKFVEARLSTARKTKRYGKDFIKLYDNGNANEFKSESEARQRLCGYLAYWLDKSKDAMIIAYKKSELYREDKAHDLKCIDNAIQSCYSTYGEFLDEQSQMGITPEMVNYYYEKIKKIDPDIKEEYKEWDDISCSNLVGVLIKEKVLFEQKQEKWYVYNGAYWEKTDGGMHVANHLKSIILALKKYYQNIVIPRIEDSNILEKKQKDELCDKKRGIYKKLEDFSKRESILKDTKSLVMHSLDEFDRDKMIFNVSNGTIVLKRDGSYIFKNHDPKDYCTKHSNVIYNPNAKNPRWELFLSEITSGNEEKSKFIRKIFGYSLSGNTEHECCFLFLGETTRNGKSTLIDTVLKMYGDYGLTGNSETVMETRKNYGASGPSEDLARLAGIRFLNIPEPENGFVINVARLKKMTGNDPINARFLNKNSFDFNPEFKIIIASNHRPVVNDDTLFSSDRIHVITFDRHFSAGNQDTTLKQSFESSNVQSAVLNWVLQGWEELRKEGLAVPACIRETTNKFKVEQDRIVQFIEECMVKKSYAEIKSQDAYEVYNKWCHQNNYTPLGRSKWIEAMVKKEIIFRKKRPSDGTRDGHGATNMLTGYELAPDYLNIYHSRIHNY